MALYAIIAADGMLMQITFDEPTDGSTYIPVPPGFALEAGAWKYDGAEWVPYVK